MSELATKSELRTSLGQLERTLDARIARLEAKQSDDRMNKRIWESTISLGALFLAGGVRLLRHAPSPNCHRDLSPSSAPGWETGRKFARFMASLAGNGFHLA